MKKFVIMALFALVSLSAVQTTSAWLGNGWGLGYGNCCGGYNRGCCNQTYYSYDNGCGCCGYGSNWY